MNSRKKNNLLNFLKKKEEAKPHAYPIITEGEVKTRQKSKPSAKEQKPVNKELINETKKGTAIKRTDGKSSLLKSFSFFIKEIIQKPETSVSRIELAMENSQPNTLIRGRFIKKIFMRRIIKR